MAIKTNIPGEKVIMDQSFNASEDLSSSQYRIVVPSGSVSAGKSEVGLPSGQGVLSMGALLNAPAEDAIAQVRMIGEARLEAGETFNAGIQLTVYDATGTVGIAASGDFVIGVSKEAAAEATQLVTVILNSVSEPQLN